MAGSTSKDKTLHRVGGIQRVNRRNRNRSVTHDQRPDNQPIYHHVIGGIVRGIHIVIHHADPNGNYTPRVGSGRISGYRPGTLSRGEVRSQHNFNRVCAYLC